MGAAGGDLERFLTSKDVLGISFSRVRYKQRIRNAADGCFFRSQSGLNMTYCSMRAGRMSTCQGTPRSEELDGKELHGALDGECHLELRGFAVFCTSLTWCQHTFCHLKV